MPTIPRSLALAVTLTALAGGARVRAQAARPPVTIGGVLFAQYQYQLADTANHANNFDVTRAYVNVVGKFTDGIGTRVTTDVFRAADGSLSIRLKYAFVSWTPSGSALTWKLGMIHTPLLAWEEDLWDYRMQGPVALDRYGYATSSDLGAGVDGSWSREALNAQLGVYDGEGYSRAPGDRRKDVAARVSARVVNTDDMSRAGGLRVTAFAHLGKPTGGGIRDRFAGILSYRSSLLTLAAELARTRDRSDDPPAPAEPTGLTVEGQVVSAFGVLHLPGTRAALIGRVDVLDPDRSIANDRQTRTIGGVSYRLTPNVRVLADVDHVSYQGNAATPAQLAARTQGLFQLEVTF